MNVKIISIWFQAIRPKTLFAAIAPVIMGLSMAYGQNFFHPVTALLTLLCAILIQIGTNLVNDYEDYKKIFNYIDFFQIR